MIHYPPIVSDQPPLEQFSWPAVRSGPIASFSSRDSKD
jgi:hypothetical protein